MSAAANYYLPGGYESRLEPEYFHDEGMDAVWQPDVYPDAAVLAELLGARKIVDLGCGDGSKLVDLPAAFELIGIDYGVNIERCRARHARGAWLELDLDSDEPLPVETNGALLVCADVIEHLVRPEKLLRRVRAALDGGAAAFVLSTPDRDLAEDEPTLGPPRNPSHVREWSRAELRAFLASEGLEGRFGLTRSNDFLHRLQTIEAVVPGPGAERARVVDAWFLSRQPWERRLTDVAEVLAAERAKTEELVRAAAWYREQLDAYREQVDAYRLESAEQRKAIEAYGRQVEEQAARIAFLERPLRLAERLRAVVDPRRPR